MSNLVWANSQLPSLFKATFPGWISWNFLLKKRVFLDWFQALFFFLFSTAVILAFSTELFLSQEEKWFYHFPGKSIQMHVVSLRILPFDDLPTKYASFSLEGHSSLHIKIPWQTAWACRIFSTICFNIVLFSFIHWYSCTSSFNNYLLIPTEKQENTLKNKVRLIFELWNLISVWTEASYLMSLHLNFIISKAIVIIVLLLKTIVSNI